jgi:hypothetical protein
MKKMKNMKRIITLTLMLGLFSAQFVYAAYSSYGTFQITNSSTYYTTTGSMLGAYKTTTASDFNVYASAKTMTSTPQVRLVNSSGQVRSDYVGVKNTNTTYTGSNNTGSVGYLYYAEVKPAWNQIGTDTITLKIDPK